MFSFPNHLGANASWPIVGLKTVIKQAPGAEEEQQRYLRFGLQTRRHAWESAESEGGHAPLGCVGGSAAGRYGVCVHS